MKYAKKSLGQNFLIDRNIVKKIIGLVDITNKDVIEIGPGKGSLTDEILKKNPKSLILIEKDTQLFENLRKKYIGKKFIKVFNDDVLKFDIEKIHTKNSLIFGNLPYNISSQILVKIIKFKNWPPKFSNLIFMFQKELGEKILGNFPSSNYGRLSILVNYRLNILEKFFVSHNSFFPKPKVTSMVIHFKPKKNNLYKIKKIENLEKITNIFFSNKRKMIKKNIKKILNKNKIKNLFKLNLNLRPADLKPEIYFKITKLFEDN
tara:strand:- start:504 stop:1289 length:786 start_codon:yes stop_codon:yes gene_type:complete